MNMIHRGSISIVILLVLALAVFSGQVARASVLETGERIYISDLHQINEDLYAFGENILIDGQIDGELLVAGYKTIINGDISGSAIVTGYSLQHKGRLARSLRAAVNTGIIDGYVGRAVVIFGSEIDIGRGAVIEQDLNAFGAMINVAGVVKGAESTIKAEEISIDGRFEGNLDLEGKKISIGPSAIIMGDLKYTVASDSDIVIDSGASIVGEKIWDRKTPEEEEADGSVITGLVVPVSKLLAAFLFGVIFLALCRRYIQESFVQLRSHFTVSLATGILAVLILVLALIILLVSVVFVITGLILSSGENPVLGAVLLIMSIVALPISSFATVSGGILFYAGKVIIGFLVGYYIFKLFRKSPPELGRWQLLAGLTGLFLIFALPYLGFLVYLFISITGAGAIILGVRKCRRNSETTVQNVSGKET